MGKPKSKSIVPWNHLESVKANTVLGFISRDSGLIALGQDLNTGKFLKFPK